MASNDGYVLGELKAGFEDIKRRLELLEDKMEDGGYSEEAAPAAPGEDPDAAVARPLRAMKVTTQVVGVVNAWYDVLGLCLEFLKADYIGALRAQPFEYPFIDG